MNNLVHVARWDPHNLYDLAHVSWVGSVLYRSCTQPLTTATEELDDLDHELSDLSVRGSATLSHTNSKQFVPNKEGPVLRGLSYCTAKIIQVVLFNCERVIKVSAKTSQVHRLFYTRREHLKNKRTSDELLTPSLTRE